MSLTALDVLGPDGLIAKRLPNYEHRTQQLDMARAVSHAIANKHHLICEAGTGVGKSFGYLVPAILAATSENKDHKINRVVVSTHTIALQEQLLTKDLPILNSVIPREFSVSLVKGRGNYVSLRRMNRAIERSAQMCSTMSSLVNSARYSAGPRKRATAQKVISIFNRTVAFGMKWPVTAATVWESNAHRMATAFSTAPGDAPNTPRSWL